MARCVNQDRIVVAPENERIEAMEGFGKLLGFLIAAAIVCAAVAGVAFLITAVIAFWPVIVGFGVLLFLGYVLFVGLAHLGDDKTK